MKGFTSIKDVETTLSWDVLFVDDEWAVKRGFLSNIKGKLVCLVDDKVYYDGEIVLLNSYPRSTADEVFRKFGMI